MPTTTIVVATVAATTIQDEDAEVAEETIMIKTIT
jgi:hypothetical protein